MPLWTDAYLGDTTHLTTIEHGAYLLLLMAMWRSKGNTLPDDDRLLARYARLTPAQWRRIKPVIMPFFDAKKGVLTQGRLTDEANAVKRHSKLQSDRVKARWLKTKETVDTAVIPDAYPLTPTPIEGSGRGTNVPPPPPSAPVREADDADAIPFDPDPEVIRATALRDQVVQAAGINIAKSRKPARWIGSEATHIVRQWIGLDLTDAEIVETVAEVAAEKPDPPDSLAYFTPAIRRRAGRKQATPLTPINGGTHDGRSARDRRAEAELESDLAFARDLDRARQHGG